MCSPEERQNPAGVDLGVDDKKVCKLSFYINIEEGFYRSSSAPFFFTDATANVRKSS